MGWVGGKVKSRPQTGSDVLVVCVFQKKGINASIVTMWGPKLVYDYKNKGLWQLKP